MPKYIIATLTAERWTFSPTQINEPQRPYRPQPGEIEVVDFEEGNPDREFGLYATVDSNYLSEMRMKYPFKATAKSLGYYKNV